MRTAIAAPAREPYAALAGALRALLTKRVWTALESQPGFNERLRNAEAELRAGGGIWYEVRNGRLVRCLDCGSVPRDA